MSPEKREIPAGLSSKDRGCAYEDGAGREGGQILDKATGLGNSAQSDSVVVQKLGEHWQIP